MNVDIDFCALTANDGPAAHAKQRLGFVMARHHDRIQRIQVRLGDIDGTFGQHGKYCRIQVDLVDALPVGCLYIGANFDELIDRAVDRAGRAVLQRLRRANACPLQGSKADAQASDLVDRVSVAKDQYRELAHGRGTTRASPDLG